MNQPSTAWYFAEGSTLDGFQPFFTMQNVSGSDATVEVTYFTNNPDSTVVKTVTVPNNARVTTDISNVLNNPAYPASLGFGFEGFGTQIIADQPIIVERPFYVNRDFPGFGFINGATDERGATTILIGHRRGRVSRCGYA